MKLVKRKVKSGQAEAIDVEDEEQAPVPSTIDFMDVLKKSVEHTSKGRGKAARGAKPRATSRSRRPRKQRAR